MDRRELRVLARERRRQAARAAAPDAAAAAARHFMAALAPAPGRVVALYWPCGDELDTQPLMMALAASCRLVLPIVEAPATPLCFRAFAPGQRLEAGRYGIPVPVAIKDPAPDIAPEVLVVPLLAFDAAGHRLGSGGGYYDRTLKALRARAKEAGAPPPVAAGFAYAGQEWPTPLPAAPWDETWDERLDWIVSEREARKIA